MFFKPKFVNYVLSAIYFMVCGMIGALIGQLLITYCGV